MIISSFIESWKPKQNIMFQFKLMAPEKSGCVLKKYFFMIIFIFYFSMTDNKNETTENVLRSFLGEWVSKFCLFFFLFFF